MMGDDMSTWTREEYERHSAYWRRAQMSYWGRICNAPDPNLATPLQHPGEEAR
jgi:hypothetical protein